MKDVLLPVNRTRKMGGFMLITTYLIVTLISVFSLAYFERSNIFLQASERNRNKIIAFNMAEAAVDSALTQLSTNSSYTGTNTFIALDSNFVRGGYTVTVSTPANSSNVRMVQASGFAPDNNITSRAYQTATITAYSLLNQQQSSFSSAVFAQTSIGFNGNAAVDSYDSRKGAYNIYTNAGTNGDLETNSIANSSVNFVGNAQIKGDVFIGPTGVPSNVITTNGNVSISGTKAPMAQARVLAASSATIPSQGALTIAGNTTQSLGEGTYHYSSLKISGNAKLNVTGPVTIYVDGSVDIKGNGIATQSNLPPNLKLVVLGNSAVSFGGNAAFYGSIYAPNASISNSGNSTIFGGIVCKSFYQYGNAFIHYDEALKDLPGASGSGKATIKAWQEQNSLTWGTGY